MNSGKRKGIKRREVKVWKGKVGIWYSGEGAYQEFKNCTNEKGLISGEKSIRAETTKEGKEAGRSNEICDIVCRVWRRHVHALNHIQHQIVRISHKCKILKYLRHCTNTHTHFYELGQLCSVIHIMNYKSLRDKPKTKDAASMPPWRLLRAGLFLQFTYPSHLVPSFCSTSCSWSGKKL